MDPINQYTLYQNYPNPFNPETNIKFSLADDQLVNIKVYDILGSEIQTLVNREYNSGTYEVIFNSKGLPSGTYFYRITAGEFSDIKKLEVLK